MLRHVEHALLQSADETLLELAESRLSCFWSDVMPAIQARWALIAAAAEVLLQADRVAKTLMSGSMLCGTRWPENCATCSKMTST